MELVNQQSPVGATVVLYDVAPFHPTLAILFDLINKIGISVFGVGAKFLQSAEKFGLAPKKRIFYRN